MVLDKCVLLVAKIMLNIYVHIEYGSHLDNEPSYDWATIPVLAPAGSDCPAGEQYQSGWWSKLRKKYAINCQDTIHKQLRANKLMIHNTLMPMLFQKIAVNG